MKATEQYFPVVLFVMLHKVVLTFQSVHGILQYDHSNETLFISTIFTGCFRYYSALEFCTTYIAI